MRARSIAITAPSGFTPLRNQLLSPTWFAPRWNRRSAPSPTTPTFAQTNFCLAATFTQATFTEPAFTTEPGRSAIDARMMAFQAPKRRKLSTREFVEVFPAVEERGDAAGTGVLVAEALSGSGVVGKGKGKEKEEGWGSGSEEGSEDSMEIVGVDV
ncbi:hypothetical protein BU16DRAFT_597392 [Lophium mytilinum]|uniref:Uncharacterized protein n=1 Tax=Lophium mytilinum TaxID=390894 RepID=A0A6A6QBK1_9PEZI|nr:hypothetical protein BU16DRAFT_597392 [Lophium mytilinum]